MLRDSPPPSQHDQGTSWTEDAALALKNRPADAAAAAITGQHLRRQQLSMDESVLAFESYHRRAMLLETALIAPLWCECTDRSPPFQCRYSRNLWGASLLLNPPGCSSTCSRIQPAKLYLSRKARRNMQIRRRAGTAAPELASM